MDRHVPVGGWMSTAPAVKDMYPQPAGRCCFYKTGLTSDQRSGKTPRFLMADKKSVRMYLENHIQKRFKISKDKTSEVVISKEVIIKEENLEKLTRTPVCNAIQTGRLSE